MAQLQNGQARYVHADGLGSVQALSDGRGALTDAYAYAAFGEVLGHAGTSEQPYRFAGEHFDPEAGMQYHRARWYDPATGRFTALDPFSGVPSRPATLHKYGYAGSDPVNETDPSGEFGVSLGGLVSGINIASNLYTVASIGFMIASGNLPGGAAAIAEEVVYSKLGGAFGKHVAKLMKNQMALFYRVFGRNVKLRLGEKASSGALRHNLEQVGVVGEKGTQAHHIVGGAYDEGRQARDILKRFDIDVNSPMNGVFLPGCGTSVAKATIHCGKHVQAYEQVVLSRIEHLNDKIAIINELSNIRNELLNGLLRLNSR